MPEIMQVLLPLISRCQLLLFRPRSRCVRAARGSHDLTIFQLAKACHDALKDFEVLPGVVLEPRVGVRVNRPVSKGRLDKIGPGMQSIGNVIAVSRYESRQGRLIPCVSVFHVDMLCKCAMFARPLGFQASASVAR